VIPKTQMQFSPDIADALLMRMWFETNSAKGVDDIYVVSMGRQR